MEKESGAPGPTAAQPAPKIELADVSFEYPAGAGTIEVLDGTSFAVADGEFVTVVGPSGCGKSTALKLIAGLLRPSGGAVRLDGRPVDRVPPGVGFMFQSDALLPWSTVLDNVVLALELRGVPRAERRERARAMVELVGLRGFEEYYPPMLSGGMRKRVALARALGYDPDVYLMDEPFGALDAQTKIQMGMELLRLWSELRRTVLFVTHDLEEAIALSDRVLVMTRRPGRVKSEHRISLPRPRDFYEVRFTAEFQELHRVIWRDLADEAVPAAA